MHTPGARCINYFSAIELLKDILDINKLFVSTFICCFCFKMFEISQNVVLVGKPCSHFTTNWYILTRRTPCKSSTILFKLRSRLCNGLVMCVSLSVS